MSSNDITNSKMASFRPYKKATCQQPYSKSTYMAEPANDQCLEDTERNEVYNFIKDYMVAIATIKAIGTEYMAIHVRELLFKTIERRMRMALKTKSKKAKPTYQEPIN